MPLVSRVLPMGGTTQRFWTVAPQAPGGSPCLFLHGARGSGRNFRLLLEDLGRRRPVFAPDLPGFGESPPLPGVVRLADHYPQALSAWLDALDLCEATVVGHSLGGAMALGVALLRPERVGRLVLIASAGAPVGRPPRAEVPPNREEQIRRVFHDPVRMAEVIGELFPAAPHPASRDLAGRGPLPDFRERLGELRMPVLLLWGEADGVTPVEAGRWFQERIDGSRLEIIPGAGHMPHLEQPEETLRHLQGFLGD